MNLAVRHRHGFNHVNSVNNNVGGWSSKTTREKVKFVVKVIFSVVLSAIAFWINPAIFFVSFGVGVIFNNKMLKAVHKIKEFITYHKWPVLVGCGIVCFLALPVFLASVTATWSLFCGSYLSTMARESLKKNT